MSLNKLFVHALVIIICQRKNKKKLIYHANKKVWGPKFDPKNSSVKTVSYESSIEFQASPVRNPVSEYRLDSSLGMTCTWSFAQRGHSILSHIFTVVSRKNENILHFVSYVQKLLLPCLWIKWEPMWYRGRYNKNEISETVRKESVSISVFLHVESNDSSNHSTFIYPFHMEFICTHSNPLSHFFWNCSYRNLA